MIVELPTWIQFFVCEILCRLSWSNSEIRMAAIVNFGPLEHS